MRFLLLWTVPYPDQCPIVKHRDLRLITIVSLVERQYWFFGGQPLFVNIGNFLLHCTTWLGGITLSVRSRRGRFQAEDVLSPILFILNWFKLLADISRTFFILFLVALIWNFGLHFVFFLILRLLLVAVSFFDHNEFILKITILIEM